MGWWKVYITSCTWRSHNNGTNGCDGDNNSLRPKSCDVPGITIYPSEEESNSNHHPNHSHHSHHNHHVPISANTGSLPDLTSFHFPAPLNTPIDIEESMLAGSSNTATATASNSHSASSNRSFHLQHNSPRSPYGHRTSQSPYSVNSNPNSPYSPQSPLSALGYSPPPPPPPSTIDVTSSTLVQHQQQMTFDSPKQDIQQQQQQTVGFGHPSHALSQGRPPMITVEVRCHVCPFVLFIYFIFYFYFILFYPALFSLAQPVPTRINCFRIQRPLVAFTGGAFLTTNHTWFHASLT